MTRHARNCTAGAVYTYHEKQKDAKYSGYGTNAQRLGKDSLRNFDCCCLSLQPCQDPVVTPDGYLFDKAAILEYYITKKNDYSRKLKEYEKQKKREESEIIAEAANVKATQVLNFVKQENEITKKNTPQASTSSEPSTSSSISNMANGNEKHVPSYWIPSKTPQAEKTKLNKPDKTIYCPMSGKPLKMKDLIPVKFTEISDPDDKRSIMVKDARYMCPVTRDTLGNSLPAAVIKTTGDVVTMDCVEKIIKKDWIHPLSGEKLTEKDIIPLQRGATGFASTNVNLEAKEARPVLQV